MAYLIGVTLALAVSLFARLVGLDRDRAFYPTVMIVIAALYGLFAVIGGHPGELTLEWIMVCGFIVVSTLGFKFSLWLVVAALFAHGIFDFFHARLIANPGVPAWWPAFCGAYDVTAAAWLAWLLRRAGPNDAKQIGNPGRYLPKSLTETGGNGRFAVPTHRAGATVTT